MKKTINSRYSLVVTYPTTNLPAHGLSTAERTGSPVFHVLWSIAEEKALNAFIYLCKKKKEKKEKKTEAFQIYEGAMSRRSRR